MSTVVETTFLSLCAEPRFTADRRGVQAQVVVKEWHRVAYSDHRPQGEPKGTVVCVHGFSRNRHDFAMLAEALSDDGWRVVCPDMPGRGPGREEGRETSDWLSDQSLYDNSQYMLDCMALIARLGVHHVHWIGTSMGGLLGMLLAAQANTPIRSLVMNDVGPSAVPKAAREHIAAYTSADASFKDEKQFAAYVREIYQGFEPLTDEQWQHLVEHSRRQRADGTLGLAFDPKIGLQLKKQMPEMDLREQEINGALWLVWMALACPVYILRGGRSEVLSEGMFEAMKASKPGLAKGEVFPACGHAPALMANNQIARIQEWLESQR
jgi:pimeloyl-ACP methyl ester carboxylesterase